MKNFMARKKQNLIEASKIQPGMTIGIERQNKGQYDDYCLIIAKSGFTKVKYTHLDFQDSYGGALVGELEGKELVEVITGRKRQHIFEHIKNDLFKNLHDVEHLIDVMRLIEAMDRTLK